VLLAESDRSNSGSDMTAAILIGATSRVNPRRQEGELMWSKNFTPLTWRAGAGRLVGLCNRPTGRLASHSRP
jgi:hypothetical protein